MWEKEKILVSKAVEWSFFKTFTDVILNVFQIIFNVLALVVNIMVRKNGGRKRIGWSQIFYTFASMIYNFLHIENYKEPICFDSYRQKLV